MRKLFAFSVIVFFLLCSGIEGLEISEIHPNPDDSCRDCSEWIELYSDDLNLGSYSLDGYILNYSIDDLIILTRNKTIFLEIWDVDPEKVKEFNIRLPNSGGEMDLNGTIISYPSFSSKSGLSYSLVNSNYSTEDPSPLVFDVEVDEPEQNDTEYTKDNGCCNLSIYIESETIFNSGESGVYYIVLEDPECHEKHPIKLAYSVEDLFGRVVFERETEKEMSCNLRIKRSWTPGSIEESKGYKILAKITDPGCDNLGEIESEKIVVVKGKWPRTASELEIERIFFGSDKLVNPGETFGVKLRIYRGDTERTSVDVWVEGSERISEVSKFNYYMKHMEGKITIPIMLFDECFEEEEFRIVAEGFGLKETSPLNIDLDSCKEIELVEITIEENITEEPVIFKNTTNNTVRIPTGSAVKKEGNFISNLMNFLNSLMFGII